MDSCIAYALKHRPDALAKRFEVQEYEADVETEKADYKPQISVIGKKVIGGSNLFSDNHTNSNSWLVGISASWDFFDNGVMRAKVKQREATLRKAKESVLDQEDTIRLEVCTILSQPKRIYSHCKNQ